MYTTVYSPWQNLPDTYVFQDLQIDAFILASTRASSLPLASLGVALPGAPAAAAHQSKESDRHALNYSHEKY